MSRVLWEVVSKLLRQLRQVLGYKKQYVHMSRGLQSLTQMGKNCPSLTLPFQGMSFFLNPQFCLKLKTLCCFCLALIHSADLTDQIYQISRPVLHKIDHQFNAREEAGVALPEMCAFIFFSVQKDE